MSQCVARRWAGKGTTTEKPTDPVLAKEMNDRLKDIQNARSQMDTMWTVKEENAIIVSEKKIIVLQSLFLIRQAREVSRYTSS